MFESETLLGGTADRSIRMDTRRGTPIQNVVEPPVHKRHYELYERFRKKFGAAWTHRKKPAPYNCFGMVFAVRRTSIFEQEEVAKILSEDGYRRVDESQVLAGDLVLYRDSKLGYVHAAIVQRKAKGPGSLESIFVLSKWNSCFGEDEHNVSAPWWEEGQFNAVSVEFWTDR